MADLATVIPVRRGADRAGGDVLRRAAAGETVDREMTTEDTAGILLRLEGGARAVCAVSQLSAGRRNACSWQVDGGAGAVAWTLGAPGGAVARPPRAPERAAAARPDAAVPARPPPRRCSRPGHAEGFADTFRELYRAVYRAVEAGAPPERPDYPTFADGHDEALIADAIAASAREGRWVEVERASTPQEVTA